MKKYFKMIPLIIYPYICLTLLLFLFIIPNKPMDKDTFIELALIPISIMLIIAFLSSIYNALATKNEKYNLLESAKINLITKCCHIPAYLIYFVLAAVELFIRVWGLEIILYALIVDFFTILLSAISSLGLSYQMIKSKSLDKTLCAISTIGSFIYVIDVIVSIVYFITARGQDIIKPQNNLNEYLPIKLKYPVLLVHGMGFRDRKTLHYWGRIPATLEAYGIIVFYGNQDANGSVETNAEVLKNEIEKICMENNIQKLNVIAHSKGGIDMRYAISKLKIGKYIASLSTINTPHNGSITLDKLLKIPKWMLKLGCKITDIWLMIFGDKSPNTYKILNSFKTSEAAIFNKEIVDDPSVYYQSFAFVMSKHSSDVIMWFPHLIVKHYEGENDGFLSPMSVKWGNFRGVYNGTTKRGISHCDEIDFRRHCFSNKEPKNEFEISDITLFYLKLVKELKEVYNL